MSCCGNPGYAFRPRPLDPHIPTIDPLAQFTGALPVTRAMCGLYAAVTGALLLQAVWPYTVMFVPEAVLQRGEVWRLVTCFFAGEDSYGFLFDFIILFLAVDHIERRLYRNYAADLTFQCIMASLALIILTSPLPTTTLTRPFLLMHLTLASKFCAFDPSVHGPSKSSTLPVSWRTSFRAFTELIIVPVRAYPWCLVFVDLMIGGPYRVGHSLVGVAVGYAWWWVVWASNTWSTTTTTTSETNGKVNGTTTITSKNAVPNPWKSRRNKDEEELEKEAEMVERRYKWWAQAPMWMAKAFGEDTIRMKVWDVPRAGGQKLGM